MSDAAERRAELLVRLYPRQWRRDFPDFVDVLAAEFVEHPRGAALGVARGAAVERLRGAGIISPGPSNRARSGLALIYATLVPFVALAMGMWSQLQTGLAGKSPDASPVLRVVDLLLGVAAAACLAVLPIGLGLSLVSSRRVDRGLSERTTTGAAWAWVSPAAVSASALTALTAMGWAVDHSRWYSPAASALPTHGVPHVITLWVRALVAPITPAWVHPSLFGRMPGGELAAVLLAPVLGLVAAVSMLKAINALPLRVPGRADVVVGLSSAGMMLLAVTASVRWLVTHPDRQGATPLLAHRDQIAPGHTGWAVVALLALMALAALAGTRRMLRSRSEKPLTMEDGLFA